MNWWSVAAGFSVALNVYLFGGLLWLRSLNAHKIDHAKCVAHLASVTSNATVARAFREAADRYDDMEGMAELTRIRNTVYDGTTPMPVLWLREQADRIEAL